MSLLPAAARWTGFLEKYVLSLLFLKIAYDRATGLGSLIGRMHEGYVLSPGSAEFGAVLVSVLTVLFGIFFGLNLLANTNPIQNPTRWREIVIPLVATFLLYAFAGLSPFVPEFMTRSLLPAGLQRSAAIASILVSVVGYAIALWSVLYLGRSLSLVVSVRTIVRRGPYRSIRHPMYLGYIILVSGFALASPSLLAIALMVIYVVRTVARARLEEDVLCAFSEEYRQHARRSGFLLPPLRRAARDQTP